LLKRAMKGDSKAKIKLYEEFGIKLYSSEEVEKYVQKRVSEEYASGGKSATNGPTAVTRKRKPKGLPKNNAKSRLRRNRSTSSPSRVRSRGKTKQLVKKA